MHFEQTELLNIAFELGGASSGSAVFLLHGWPDAPAGWTHVASKLQEQGYITIVPYLRGSHPTEFRSQATPRFAGAVAMAQDVVDLANKLGIERLLSLDTTGEPESPIHSRHFSRNVFAPSQRSHWHISHAVSSIWEASSNRSNSGISSFNVQMREPKPYDEIPLGLLEFNGTPGALEDGSPRRTSGLRVGISISRTGRRSL